jgi:hypothetical protein
MQARKFPRLNLTQAQNPVNQSYFDQSKGVIFALTHESDSFDFLPRQKKPSSNQYNPNLISVWLVVQWH